MSPYVTYYIFEPVNFLYKVNSLILVDLYCRFKSFEWRIELTVLRQKRKGSHCLLSPLVRISESSHYVGIRF